MTEIQELPEGCIATILSRTTPVDTGRFSVISKTFRSAADSDAVWNQFLPSNFVASVVSQSPSLANAPTKKALYLALSHHPIIIDNGLKGTINSIALSPNTEYAAYLVFKMVEAHGFQNRPVELSVFVEGGLSSTKNVCLDPNGKGRSRHRVVGLQFPNVRSDGWLEIEMGKFFNSGIENEQVHMKVLETKRGNWKNGFIVEGIEVRPK